MSTVHEVGSIDWVAARKRGLGASELAAAIGVSRWKSRLDLWKDKTGRSEAVPENAAMKWGKRLENWVIEDWCELHGAEVIGDQVTLQVASEPVEIWATLDALVQLPDGTQCPLEAKTTSSRNAELGNDDTDQIPLEWICQAQAQMAAANASVCHFAVLIDGREMREYTVQRDDAVMAGIIAKAAEFWGYVQRDEVPPIEWASTDQRLSRFAWLEDSGDAIDLRGQLAAQVWVEYENLGREIGRLEKEREQLKADFVVALGDSHRAIIDDGREVVVQQVNRAGYTVEPKTYFQLKARKAK